MTKEVWSTNNDDKDINVEAQGNHLFFYSPVDDESILQLNKALKKIEQELIKNSLQYGFPQLKIYLHIKSGGGSLTAGFAGLDIISQSKYKVTTIVEGCAASAATLLSLAGDERHITAHSYMLIHQLSSATWGRYEQMKDDMENFDMWMKHIITFYKEKTKIKEKELKEMLKRDIWLDAKKCINLGLVDKII